LTSIGVSDKDHRGIFLDERVVIGDVSEDELNTLVVGDLGGVMLPRRDLKGPQRKRIRQMMEGWTGVQMDDLRRCAFAARKNDRPGVVVIACGKIRAAAVRRAVELGLVNELILDAELAGEL